MKVLRRISGKTRLDRVRNEVIRTNLHQKPITEKVAEKQLKWYGHVRRMDETKKPKQYMEARPEGRRQRGRQNYLRGLNRTAWKEEREDHEGNGKAKPR